MLQRLAQIFSTKQAEQPIVSEKTVSLPYTGPFDIKKARQGFPVCFRSGKPCEIENISDDDMVLVSFYNELDSLHEGKALEKCLFKFYSNGFFSELEETGHDLMMAVVSNQQ